MPVAMVVLGLLIVVASYLQPECMVTVQERGQVYYTPEERSGRSGESSRYRTRLKVTYTDDQGRTMEAEVPFETIHLNEVPEPGDVIAVSRSLTGMGIHPNQRIFSIGSVCALIGGYFLFAILVTRWRMDRSWGMKQE